MGCERGRNYKRKNESEGSYSMKGKYPFMLRYVPSGSGWKVTVKCEFHNHVLASDLDGHDILVRLKDNERKFVIEMTKYNMAPRYIIVALKDIDLENMKSVTQVDKSRYTYKMSKRGLLTEMQHHPSFIHEEKYIEVVQHVSFGVDFLLYIQNKQVRLSLLEIVGVTSMRLTFSAGFAYMKYEREENIIWALEKLKELFSFEKFLLKVLVLDRELTLMNVVKVVFLNLTHLF
ncbi:uncharacterized protein LOC131658306 [Vicia villosa]|uniref:uncharacterized protein LOC131658306 n=1 Tax=Vicia villosa TaxID=3911 RepID=UPI00273C1524|nr:uncharacterized protein LOC131658306 [Vicia villosa]